MKKLKQGVLIVFEGIDGAGKSTQARALYEKLKRAHFDAVLSKEPTDGKWGQRLKKLIQEGRKNASAQEELEWFIKDRREHVERIISPGLKDNKIVVLDRYYFSTMAYQGPLGFEPGAIERRNAEFAPPPELLFLIEMAAQCGLRRIAEKRGGKADFFEKEEYLLKVNEIFEKMRKPFLHRLAGEQTIQELSDQVWNITIGYLRDRKLVEE